MNWGNKLLLTFIVFVAGMSFLVYKSTRTEFDLVEKDYYKQELGYQQIINSKQEAESLSEPVSFTQSENGVVLQLPAEMKDKTISGEVWFYCAYDKKKDKKFSLLTNKEGAQIFQLASVEPGTYTVKVSWKDESKNYYSEKPLVVL
jgi:hypothetical protein